MQALPLVVGLLGTSLLVVASIEAGYRLGQGARRQSEDEKESPVSAIAGAILGLLAFILAFTFGIVSDRYDARKALVREEASAIRTAWSRAAFLPEADRAEATALLEAYVDLRLAAVRSGSLGALPDAMRESDRIQRALWETAVDNARLDMNSDVAALYLEALNELTNVHWLRVAVGVQVRIPALIWVVLYALVVLGMLGVGYQTAIAGSRRTWAVLILAMSFALVMALINELDRPESALLTVTQQPLEDLRAWMRAGVERPAGTD